MIWGLFWKKYRKLLGYATLFLLPLAAFYIDEIRFPKTLFVQKINSWIVHPIAQSINNSLAGVTYIFNNYVALIYVKSENDVLKKEIQKLKLEVGRLQENGMENMRLFALLDLKKSENGSARVAQIIGEDAAPDRLTYLINLGTKDGIAVKSPVITPDGVVGQVRDVFDRSAVVVTLLDPSHVIDAVDTRSRSHALVEGTGREYLGKTKFVDRIEDFKVGDLLISSGLEGVYPKGYPVGSIVEVRKPAQGVLQVAHLRPAVDFDKLEEVLVLSPVRKDIFVRAARQEAERGEAR